MALPLNSKPVEQFSESIISALISAKAMVERAQAELTEDKFNVLLNIPSQNKQLQDQISAITASQYTSKIVSDISSKLPSAITVTDILGFTDALNAFANLVENNASIFEVSINPTTKRAEFVTPVSASIKATIQDNISAILAEVS